MAAFPRSHHDPLNILTAPSPLPGLREHEAAPSIFPTRGSNNLVHASKVFPKRVPLYLLKKITNGFSEDRELGTGAYGKVYKGVHKNGETIAVKLLHSMPGLDDERFEEEFHNLARLQHKNIVRLVGFCHEIQREFVLHDGKMIFADSKHMALCFEYMHNGSLDKYIFDEYSGHDWPTRYAIIKGICEGLKYLHEELNPPIYHLDLKPANILLDDNMMPKLADFGLSKIFEQERTRITKSYIGTHGYLPPEYIDANVISNKLDIFSLGVIIIKIITGPTGYTQCAEMPSKQFVELVHQRWKNRLQATPVDECALETYSEQVMGCIEMALSCVEIDRHKRPSIGAMIEKLNKMETTTDQVNEISDEDFFKEMGFGFDDSALELTQLSEITTNIDYQQGGLARDLEENIESYYNFDSNIVNPNYTHEDISTTLVQQNCYGQDQHIEEMNSASKKDLELNPESFYRFQSINLYLDKMTCS